MERGQSYFRQGSRAGLSEEVAFKAGMREETELVMERAGVRSRALWGREELMQSLRSGKGFTGFRKLKGQAVGWGWGTECGRVAGDGSGGGPAPVQIPPP